MGVASNIARSAKALVGDADSAVSLLSPEELAAATSGGGFLGRLTRSMDRSAPGSLEGALGNIHLRDVESMRTRFPRAMQGRAGDVTLNTANRARAIPFLGRSIEPSGSSSLADGLNVARKGMAGANMGPGGYARTLFGAATDRPISPDEATRLYGAPSMVGLRRASREKAVKTLAPVGLGGAAGMTGGALALKEAQTEEEVLKHNKWISLKRLNSDDPAVDGSVYSHETRCDGQVISVLPYRKTDTGHEFLLRREVTGPWGSAPQLSTITGGYEGRDPRDTAVKEVLEEAGYQVQVDDLIELGTCFAAKSSDTINHLYAVDLTGKSRGEADGDGSAAEEEATTVWSSHVHETKDPLAYVAMFRLAPLISPKEAGFRSELNKVAVGGLLMGGLNKILDPVGKAVRGIMGTGAKSMADSTMSAAAFPIRKANKFIMGGPGMKGKLMRAGTVAGTGMTAYDIGNTTQKNLSGGVYRQKDW